VDTDGAKLTFRRLAADGKEIDRFVTMHPNVHSRSKPGTATEAIMKTPMF